MPRRLRFFLHISPDSMESRWLCPGRRGRRSGELWRRVVVAKDPGVPERDSIADQFEIDERVMQGVLAQDLEC